MNLAQDLWLKKKNCMMNFDILNEWISKEKWKNISVIAVYTPIVDKEEFHSDLERVQRRSQNMIYW